MLPDLNGLSIVLQSCQRLSILDNCISSDWKVSNLLRDLVNPILLAPAFKRLEGISFLGILSPRYAKISKSPIYKRQSLRNTQLDTDGSRADHCIGVAEIAVETCQKLRLSLEQQKYAAAWGLLHDLGNWPLSHSAQLAFSQLVGAKTKQIRNWLILGDNRAPPKYFVSKELQACGIDPDRILGLFNNNPDKDLQPISELFQSPLTPDMIEGVWRSGRVFGINNYNPYSLIDALYIDLANHLVVHREYFDDVKVFWKTKREVYSRFFASTSAVKFESACSRAVLQYYQKIGLTLQESLDLNEENLVLNVSELIHKVSTETHRWKPPVRQRIDLSAPKSLLLRALDRTFVEEVFDVR